MSINYQEDYAARVNGSRKQYHGANINFTLETVPDQAATDKANGVPKFKEVEIITVQYPGGEITPVLVNDSHRKEYAEQYAAFKAKEEQPLDGSPLSHWALIPRPVVEELKYFQIKTVEQLAELDDTAKRKIGPLSTWCKKAKEWVKAGTSTQTEVTALREQLERQTKRSDKLENDLAIMIQRVEANEGIRFEHDATKRRN